MLVAENASEHPSSGSWQVDPAHPPVGQCVKHMVNGLACDRTRETGVPVGNTVGLALDLSAIRVS